jgi:TolA-binding protein
MNDAPLWLWLTLGCTATAVASVAASRWWFARRLGEMERQLEKLDKARQFAAHQAAQARKQIERLQAELVTQQRNHAKVQATRQRLQALDIVLGEHDLGQADATAPPATPISFSDTMPMASLPEPA